MDDKKAIKVLIEVAQGNTYESEYDGVCDTYCSYCDKNLDHGEHSKDCLMFLARDAIREEFAEFNEKERKADHELYKNSWAYQIERIPCNNCGKLVKRVGLSNHMKGAGCRS